MKKNQPAYRLGQRQRRQIAVCLSLIDQCHAGCLTSSRQRALVQMLERELTGRQLDYLRYYYAAAMTHGQIARQLGRSPSTVSRGILRAEAKFLQVMERCRPFWGDGFLDG
ncbi:MAG: helix-turn-helix domain-containing protein [Clostridiales bacterium]|nr:helix-turn-helix domain-containing protein [Clostridiales bacterium]